MSGLEEMRKRYEAATPGPWKSHDGGFAQEAVVYAEGGERPRIAVCEYLDAPKRRADAEFIAHARKDLENVVRTLEKISGWHVPYEDIDGSEFCVGCSWRWPCDTRQFIDSLEES